MLEEQLTSTCTSTSDNCELVVFYKLLFHYNVQLKCDYFVDFNSKSCSCFPKFH